MREALWPHASREQHLAEIQSFLAEPNRFCQFIAYGEGREPVGFVEASIRRDHVNGTDRSPVAFLEGLYVERSARRHGWARLLVAEVVVWALRNGIQEIASDTQLENELSQSVHRALGFEETERVVYFRKTIVRNDRTD